MKIALILVVVVVANGIGTRTGLGLSTVMPPVMLPFYALPETGMETVDGQAVSEYPCRRARAGRRLEVATRASSAARSLHSAALRSR